MEKMQTKNLNHFLNENPEPEYPLQIQVRLYRHIQHYHKKKRAENYNSSQRESNIKKSFQKTIKTFSFIYDGFCWILGIANMKYGFIIHSEHSVL